MTDNNNNQFEIDINPNIESQTDSSQPVQTAEEAQPVAETKDQLALAEVIAQAITISRQATQEEHNQALEKAQREKAARTLDLSGRASAVFKKKMEKEIADGKFYTHTHYPALAKQYGDMLTMTISGYTLGFIKGQKTRIPNSLLEAVELRFGGVNLLDKQQTKRVLTFSNQGSNVVDNALNSQVEEAISSVLPKH